MGSDEFGFPEPILQIIQSFLSARNAAKSALLSKSWGSAWLTRPNLDFDLAGIKHRRFDSPGIPFSEFADKTLKRYEQSNLKIESFRLLTSESNPKHNPWILKALQLGATRLTIRLSRDDFALPDELFGSQNIVSLTLESCKISNREVIACSKLQSLSLHNVKLQSIDMVFRIISSCPFLRKLSLRNINVECHDHHSSSSSRYLLDAEGSVNTIIHCHGLRSLILYDVFFDTLFLGDDLSSKFPCLKQLTLTRNYYLQEATLNISSPSLEYVEVIIDNKTRARMKFDLPSIRKFSYRGSVIPKLSIRSNPRGSWESHLSLGRRKSLSALWFRKLNKFLTKLRRSKISLSIHVLSKATFDYEAGDIQGLPTPETENLNIYHQHLPSISCLVLFDGLFRVCRPKFITHYDANDDYYYFSSNGAKTNNIVFLGKKILQALDVEIPIPGPYQFMYGLNDLKEARAEIFDELVSAWRDAPLDQLSSITQSKTRQNNNQWDDESLEDALSDDTRSAEDDDQWNHESPPHHLLDVDMHFQMTRKLANSMKTNQKFDSNSTGNHT